MKPERIWDDVSASWPDCDFPSFGSKMGDDLVEYIRADLVPQWQPIETAPKDGTEFQALAYNKSFKDYYWIPCAKFETPMSRVPSAYLYESKDWAKSRTGEVKYWTPSVPLNPPPATPPKREP